MPAFLTRAVLKNYKSIASCDVRLGSLVFLAGPSGSGKSNFLDGLHFAAEALRTSVGHALRARGGIGEVRRRSAGHPNHFGIHFEFTLADGAEGCYTFEIGARPHGGFEVEREACAVRGREALDVAEFAVENGRVIAGPAGPPASPEHLYLPDSHPRFRPVSEALCAMRFYSVNPETIRDLQPADPGRLLAGDGANLAAVLERLPEAARGAVEAWLARVVPGLEGVEARALGPRETVEFRQNGWRFPAASMSEGTLRALGILVALFQPAAHPLIAIEEPEMALHPAAAGAIRGALLEASGRGQVLATSHNEAMLEECGPEAGVLAVYMIAGNTHVAPLEGETRAVLRDHLYLPPELLPEADEEPVEPLPGQLGLFEAAGKAE